MPPRGSLDYSKWDKLAATLTDSDEEEKDREKERAAAAARKWAHENNGNPDKAQTGPPPAHVLLRSNAMLEVFACSLSASLVAASELGLGTSYGKAMFATLTIALYFAQTRDDDKRWSIAAHIGRNAAWALVVVGVVGITLGLRGMVQRLGVFGAALLLLSGLRHRTQSPAPVFFTMKEEASMASGSGGSPTQRQGPVATPAGDGVLIESID